MTNRFEKEKYRQGYNLVVGCDEVGRGSLAGPVVAAAVVLHPQMLEEKVERKFWFHQVRDSKQLQPQVREELSELIKSKSLGWGIGAAEPKVIDEMNIHNATLLAMRRAVENLLAGVPSETISHSVTLDAPRRNEGFRTKAEMIGPAQDYGRKCFLYLDGKFIIPKFDMEQEAVVAGDGKILSVAAASIVAKVYRDRLMTQLHERYPAYDLAQHKGYGTLHHRRMIIKYGLSDIHRASFCKNLAA